MLLVLLHRLIELGIRLREILQLLQFPVTDKSLSLLLGDILNPADDVSLQLFFLLQAVLADRFLLHDLAVGFLDDEMIGFELHGPPGNPFQKGIELRPFFLCDLLWLFFPRLLIFLLRFKVPISGLLNQDQ